MSDAGGAPLPERRYRPSVRGDQVVANSPKQGGDSVPRLACPGVGWKLINLCLPFVSLSGLCSPWG